MKLQLTLLAALSVMLVAASFMISSCRDTLPPGPKPNNVSDTIAWWPHPLIDGKDATGHGHDATWPFTTPRTESQPERFGKLLLTAHATMTVKDTSNLNFTRSDSYTITAWVFCTGTNDNFSIYKQTTSGSTVGYNLAVINGYPRALITLHQTDTLLIPGKDFIADSGWHLLALSVKGGVSATLYVDSLFEGTMWTNQMTPEYHNDGPLMVYGTIYDEILIYGRTLDASEIAARFHERGWYGGRDKIPTSNNVGIWTIPPPGTMFVFTPGLLNAHDTVVIEDTGLRINGKSNVIAFDTLHSFKMTGFLAYESNNDISIGGDSAFYRGYWPDWSTLPASNRRDTLVLQDTIMPNIMTGGNSRYRAFKVTSLIGKETLSVLGQSMVTFHMRDESYQMTDDTINNRSIAELWMSPELGFWVKTHTEYWQNNQLTVAFDRNLTAHGKLW